MKTLEEAMLEAKQLLKEFPRRPTTNPVIENLLEAIDVKAKIGARREKFIKNRYLILTGIENPIPSTIGQIEDIETLEIKDLKKGKAFGTTRDAKDYLRLNNRDDDPIMLFGGRRYVQVEEGDLNP